MATSSMLNQGGHRLPFTARWPGKIEAASVSDQFICHGDLLATVAAITGVKLAARMKAELAEWVAGRSSVPSR